MIQYTAEQLKEAADENGFVAVLSGMGVTPHVRIPMSNDFLDQPLDYLDLSTRAWNGLMRYGITTLRKLVECLSTPGALGNIRNFGKKTAAEVKCKLTEAAYLLLTDREKLEFWEYFRINSDDTPRSSLYAHE